MDLDWAVRRENDDTERGGNVPRAGQTEWSEVITLVTVDNVEIPPTNPTGRQVSLSPDRPLHVVEDLVRADWVEDSSSSQQVILHNQISEIFILITMD